MPPATPPFPTPASNDEARTASVDSLTETRAFDDVQASPGQPGVRARLAGLKDPARARAQAIFDDLRSRSAAPRAKADTFVREKPYAALGVAVVAGALISRLLRRR